MSSFGVVNFTEREKIALFLFFGGGGFGDVQQNMGELRLAALHKEFVKLQNTVHSFDFLGYYYYTI